MQHNWYKTGMKLDFFLIIINSNWGQFEDDIFQKNEKQTILEIFLQNSISGHIKKYPKNLGRVIYCIDVLTISSLIYPNVKRKILDTKIKII